jgi:hypothetical protein
MYKRTRLLSIILVLTAALAPSISAQHPTTPPGMTHEEHLAPIQEDAHPKERGEAAMGFDQDTTTHHFTRTADGGRINVADNDPLNASGIARIRIHLATIAGDFGEGNFRAPFATHGETPPGVSTLRAKRRLIRYQYEDTPHGGRVVIATSDRKARSAIHAFLCYQIREHATGDSPSPVCTSFSSEKRGRDCGY